MGRPPLPAVLALEVLALAGRRGTAGTRQDRPPSPPPPVPRGQQAASRLSTAVVAHYYPACRYHHHVVASKWGWAHGVAVGASELRQRVAMFERFEINGPGRVRVAA